MSLYKKGNSNRQEDYTGATQMNTAGKVNAMVLAKRLRKNINGKRNIAGDSGGLLKG